MKKLKTRGKFIILECPPPMTDNQLRKMFKIPTMKELADTYIRLLEKEQRGKQWLALKL